MPLLISKGDRRRYKELLEMTKKSIQDSDSEEDGMVDYEQKRLQNILDRKNKIFELKVNFKFLVPFFILVMFAIAIGGYVGHSISDS